MMSDHRTVGGIIINPAARAVARNLRFWGWYPELLLPDLTPAQLRWQPEHNDSSIAFATWHAYRAADELSHGVAMKRPSVFATQGWEKRLPVHETGRSAFGNGFTREQIGRLEFDAGELIAYSKAVGEALASWAETATDEEASAEVNMPVFATVYPGYDKMTRIEAVTFFAIAHTAEHLGEVQLLRGLQGLKGAPL